MLVSKFPKRKHWMIPQQGELHEGIQEANNTLDAQRPTEEQELGMGDIKNSVGKTPWRKDPLWSLMTPQKPT